MGATPGEELTSYLDETDREWWAEEEDPQRRRVGLALEALASQLRRLEMLVVAYGATDLVLLLSPWHRLGPAVAAGVRAGSLYGIAAFSLVVAVQGGLVVRDYRRSRRERRLWESEHPGSRL